LLATIAVATAARFPSNKKRAVYTEKEGSEKRATTAAAAGGCVQPSLDMVAIEAAAVKGSRSHMGKIGRR
jgi:hypothetical protein